MEQKQLDELDESFFGEEFIDEDDFSKEFQTKPKTKSKKINEKITEKMSDKKSKSAKHESTKHVVNIKKTAKAKPKVELHLNSSQDEDYPEIKITPESMVEESDQEEVSIIPAVEEPIGGADFSEEDNVGFFSKASTWQILFVLVGILLVFSLLTQGFNNTGSPTGGATLSITDAESKALNYVNNNLLQPPYTAEITSSKDLGNLYQLTLSVAGQTIDSYLTKDGQLFFPQGFSLTEIQETEPAAETTTEETVPSEEKPKEESLSEEKTETKTEEEKTEEKTKVEEKTEEKPETIPEEKVIVPAEKQPPVTEVPSEKVPPAATTNQQFTITAKRWSFTPNLIAVKKGENVKLTVILDKSVPAFALAQINFAVPGLQLEKTVTDSVDVEFTASQQGSFEFKCSSCEDWRGMTGTIVVE